MEGRNVFSSHWTSAVSGSQGYILAGKPEASALPFVPAE